MSATNTKSPQKGSDPNRGLRLMVISMGVLLVGGTVLLFVLLALGYHKKDRSAAAAPKALSCDKQQLSIAADEEVLAMRMKNDRAYVEAMQVNEGGGRLLEVDMCSGAVLRELVVTPKE